MAPENISIKFVSGNSAGFTEICFSSGADSSESGHDIASFDELFECAKSSQNIVVKTDIDGLDCEIMKLLLQCIEGSSDSLGKLKIFFTEGPSGEQIYDDCYQEFIDPMNRFLELGYRCGVFSNHGNLVVDDISSAKGLCSALSGIKMSMYNEWDTGHIYDYIFTGQSWIVVVGLTEFAH